MGSYLAERFLDLPKWQAQLAASAGLRNVLTHGYAVIDVGLVAASIRKWPRATGNISPASTGFCQRWRARAGHRPVTMRRHDGDHCRVQLTPEIAVGHHITSESDRLSHGSGPLRGLEPSSRPSGWRPEAGFGKPALQVLRGRLVTSEHDQRDGWRGSPAEEAGFGSPGRPLR
jgi:hypothetical protein